MPHGCDILPRKTTKRLTSKNSSVSPSAKPNGSLIIYVSGDLGSMAIVQLMVDKGVTFDRRDIRKDVPGEGARDLIFLQKHGLSTVPQLFTADGERIGGFEEARMHLVTLPDPKPTLSIA